MTHKGKIELEGMIEDPMCTVVFLLEYILVENGAKEKRVILETCIVFNIAFVAVVYVCMYMLDMHLYN